MSHRIRIRWTPYAAGSPTITGLHTCLRGATDITRYVAESDPKEDLEEYEDDETEDGPVNYPMDRGDDRDDDDRNSSGDDADDENEEEEEEHLAPADSTVVVPIVEHVSPPDGTELVILLPSTDITTAGARITVRLQ
ncbi:hypothetical protein Tco_0104137, partial [Tanacetum coccineum]